MICFTKWPPTFQVPACFRVTKLVISMFPLGSWPHSSSLLVFVYLKSLSFSLSFSWIYICKLEDCFVFPFLKLLKLTILYLLKICICCRTWIYITSWYFQVCINKQFCLNLNKISILIIIIIAIILVHFWQTLL